MKHENLSVKGMTCASCVASVEKATAKLDGITNVNVNLTTEKLTFDYDMDKVSIEDVKKAVKAVGYEILTETETADEHQ
ncbi:copper ion binding protein, partial [Acholeplasma laidlawii]